jgi:cell fate (sporulation/competence/biofilm development) regulator YlbF (YheA/YmcA/DUF963 family)
MMNTGFTPALHEATEALVGNLLASEAFICYQQARKCLDQDVEARALLDQLEQTQASLRQKQADRSLTQAEIDALRGLQEQVQRNKVVMAYAQTQQEAIDFLREINQKISQLLGINFAAFANHSTC